MKIALTGAGGFLGRALTAHLSPLGHTVLPWNLRQSQAAPQAEAVVHLAGEPIAQRWTREAKQRISASRVEGTRRLIAELAKLEQRPRVLVSASAIGFYGSRGDEVLTEQSAPGNDFLPSVCIAWEQAAREAAPLGIRVVSLRFGIVLGRDGGALPRMLTPFRLGAGGRLGSGRQWMSWIHQEDALGLVDLALGLEQLSGAINATAPNPVVNAEFTRQLAATLHRPAFTPAPAFILKLVLGEMAGLLLDSQRVLPRIARDAGYSFRYPELAPALNSLLK